MKIILWLVFAIIMQRWQTDQLAMASLILAVGLLPGKGFMLSALIKRTGILMLSLFLLYGFTIPGETLLPFLGAWSPTVQGLADGSMQAWKLLLLLASLALILGTTGKEQFLYGIYWLFRPMQFLGIDRQRIAARIGLTLEYAVQQKAHDDSWFKRLKVGIAHQDEADRTAIIALAVTPFRWQDGCLMGLGIVLLVWMSK